MGQFFGNEKITKLVKSSSTVVNLPSGSKLKLGGQGYTDISSLNCTTSTSGFGGIDTGSIAASTFYYVYAVVQSGVVGLVASTSSTSPTGFNAYRKVGAFYTDGSSNIFKAYWFGEIATLVYTAFIAGGGSFGQVSGENTNWITGNGTADPTVLTLEPGIFSVAPNVTFGAFDAASGHGIMEALAVSTTSITVDVNRTLAAGAAATQRAFYITAHKTGIDAVQPDWSL